MSHPAVRKHYDYSFLQTLIGSCFCQASTGKRVAVDGLNLKIYKGQITALLGHNGAGSHHHFG